MRLDTLRILCTIKVILRLEVNQMDIKGAYLNLMTNAEIYMRQPPGFEIKDRKVCKLRRSPYGLKQAVCEWNRRFNYFLIQLKLKRVKKIISCTQGEIIKDAKPLEFGSVIIFCWQKA